MAAKYFDIHVQHDRKNSFSIPFKTNIEGWTHDEIVELAVKAGKIEFEDGKAVDNVDEIWQDDYLKLGGNEEEDDYQIEQNEIELDKAMKRCQN